ncbi:ATP-dependent helicase [Thalassolituus sp. LLYu03]|uniref:ATP-dependent helicase n=1 Tax=Thalassolituus sp. LLYu03 TaxID=3421656 RepID=UPI003D26B1B0
MTTDSSLTPQQQQVIAHREGHARVVAVAGAGKTTTLTHFIGARLAEGLNPRRMLVLMYNRAARVDFERKLTALLPNQALPEVRTFHSLGLRIYQRLIAQGVLPPFQGKPLSDGEAEPVVWRLLQQLADDDTRQDILSQRKKWVEPALGFIDLVKAGLQSPQDVFESLELPPQCRMFVELFDQFEDWRRQQRRISYADMLYDPVMAFMYQPEVAAQFGGHMQWILVDEYQDINEIQQALLDVLHGGRGSVMVIGDPDQTIYEFRGSKPDFIVSGFHGRMGQVADYQLPHTFRYGHELSLLANHLISHNKERDDVLCLSHESTPHTRIKLHEAHHEPALILKLIQSELEKHPAEDIAVINRLWALCAPIELGLLQANIPYQLHNSQSVLDRYELQIFWLLLEIAAGEFGKRTVAQRMDAWLTVLTTPYPKIKRSLLEDIARKAAVADQHFGNALAKAIPEELSKWQRQQLDARAQIIASAEQQAQPAYRILYNYSQQTELEDGIADSAFSAQQVEDKLQTIRAFIRFMRDSGKDSREAFAYLQELKAQRLRQSEGGQQGVHLTSIHKSKGLEWPVVIIPGLNAHYYPYTPDGEFTTPASEESERRLLYVAMTRARHQLHLMAPAIEKKDKNHSNAQQWQSRFRQEMQAQRSADIGRALHTQAESVEVNPIEGALPLWLERYFDAVQLRVRLTMAALPERTGVAKSAGGAYPKAPDSFIIDRKHHGAAPVRRMRHQSLGMGTVLSEDEQYIKIRFDGEAQARTLNKQVALAMLREA